MAFSAADNNENLQHGDAKGQRLKAANPYRLKPTSLCVPELGYDIRRHGVLFDARLVSYAVLELLDSI